MSSHSSADSSYYSKYIKFQKALPYETVQVDLRIEALAPKVFKYIRFMDGIDESEIIESLDPKNNKY